MTLSNVPLNEVFKIIKVESDEDFKKRLFALGFREGKQIEVIRKAMYGGPIQVRLGTTDIILRKNVADYILISDY